MTDNCTDTSNENYVVFWFDYFVSIGYIDSSDVVNIYAPYGKCTRTSLWITYLINVIHFFLLSSGVLYLLSLHRNQIGLWWPFVTWISSFFLFIAAAILFILLNLSVKLFSILIIAFEIAGLLILTVSLFAVIQSVFNIEYRYQRCLFSFIIILFVLQIGCFTAQIIITLHCLFNLKFVSMTLDYSYLSAIIAAIGTTISSLLLDHFFLWILFQRTGSMKVGSTPSSQSSRRHTRATSPVDPVVLSTFHSHPRPYIYHVYTNSDQTRHFHIKPTKNQPTDGLSNTMQLEEVGFKRRDT